MATERSVKVDEVAISQHGLITTGQAVQALGLSRKNRWVAERRLISIQPGVFRLVGAPETWHQSLLAASLAVDGVVSHRSAAELWGLTLPAGHVELSVPKDVNRSVRPPAVVHRIGDLRPGLAVDRQGLRVTDPVRTIIDLGLVVSRWQVQRAIATGISRKVFTIGEISALRDALGRPGRNGTGIVRAILDGKLVPLGKEDNELERRFAALARRAGLSELEPQHEVWHDGRFVARVDAALPAIKLAIEVDGFGHHSTPEQFQYDRARQNELVAIGWTVLRFTWDDIVRRPAQVARTIEQAIGRLTAA